MGEGATTRPSPGASRHPLPTGEGRSFVPPLRVVLDPHLDALQANANLLDGSAPTLVLHAPDAKPPDDRYARVELAATSVDTIGRFDLEAVLALLAAREVNELQVEAGPTLCGALFARNLTDELLLYIAPVLLGDSAQPLLTLPPLAEMTARKSLLMVDQRRVDEDWRWLLRTRES